MTVTLQGSLQIRRHESKHGYLEPEYSQRTPIHRPSWFQVTRRMAPIARKPAAVAGESFHRDL